MQAALHMRPWQAGDSVAALTALLHCACTPLATAGVNFTAATRTDAMTLQRMPGTHTFAVEPALPAAAWRRRCWVAARSLLAVDATLSWRASGAHLGDADAIGAHRRDTDHRSAG